MRRIFEALAPEHLQNDARSLVEYSCFRYLSRDNSDLHPNLKVNQLLIQHMCLRNIVIIFHVSSDEFVSNKVTLGLVCNRLTRLHLSSAKFALN